MAADATSFIGSHVCAHLLKQNHTLVGLDDLSGGFRNHVS